MSKLTAMHTLDDVADLANGNLEEADADALLRRAKKGLTPVQFACLRSALQTDRLLTLLDVEPDREETQADRIEALLLKLVEAVELLTTKVCAIESARGRPSA